MHLQVNQLKEVLSKDRSAILQENDKLKKQVMDLDKEFNDVQSKYSCDQELWANRSTFFEQQKDIAKADLAEAQKKFAETIEQLQKRSSVDKEKQDQNHTALISSLDQKHRNQIKELSETYERKLNEIIQKNKQYEKEIKNMNDQHQFEQRSKQSEQNVQDKKITEYQDLAKKLSKDLDDVKSEKEKKMLEYQKMFEREREANKAKLQEAESKFAEADGKRSALYLEFEKERARWSVERDQLICQKNQAQETVAILEKKKESITQELNNMKSTRTARKPLYQGVGNSTTSVHATSRYSSFANAKSKENITGIKPAGIEAEKMHDTSETDSNHSGKIKIPTKVAISYSQKNEDAE